MRRIALNGNSYSAVFFRSKDDVLHPSLNSNLTDLDISEEGPPEFLEPSPPPEHFELTPAEAKSFLCDQAKADLKLTKKRKSSTTEAEKEEISKKRKKEDKEKEEKKESRKGKEAEEKERRQSSGTSSHKKKKEEKSKDREKEKRKSEERKSHHSHSSRHKQTLISRG